MIWIFIKMIQNILSCIALVELHNNPVFDYFNRPMTLDIPGSDLSGIYVLRTPEDGNAIVQQAKDKHVVVIGTSFIGSVYDL